MFQPAFRLAALAAAAGLPALAPAQWPLLHRNAENNALLPIAATVTDIDGSPAWATAQEDVFQPVRPLISGGVVYAAAASNGGTIYNPADDSIRMRAYDQVNGTQLWQSALLDAGNAVSYTSFSGLALDEMATTPALYFGSGTSVQKLAAADGSLLWSMPFATELPASGAHDIINSTPALGADRLFVQTTNFGTSPSLLVALDKDTGNVDWSVPTGGQGVIMPLYVDFGSSQTVIADAVSGNGAGLAAFDPQTGATLWNHSTVSSPWGVTGGFSIGFYADLIYHNGRVYGLTYDFSAAGKLVCVNAATGEADFVVSAVGTDVPLVLVGGNLYTIGGSYGDADLVRYDAATGAATPLADLGFTVFRNYLAAANDHLYFTSSDGGLYVYGTNGAAVSAHAGAFTGPVTLDAEGRVYASDGKLKMFDQTSSVVDWQALGDQ